MAERGRAAALLGVLLLTGCAGDRLAREPLALPPATRLPRSGPLETLRQPRPELFRVLAGWAGDDHLAALVAFRDGCRLSGDSTSRFVCDLAENLRVATDTEARLFFEEFFRPEPISGAGLLTAYFTPIYEARTSSDTVFSAPVRPRPADLPRPDINPRVDAPYATRAAIESRAPADALGWMRPEDLFVLQIQGSGVLVFPGGARAKAVFDGANGAPFRGIAAPMREKGLLADTDTSGEAIRAWLATHRGPTADAIMRLNPRYVFFRLVPDDGATPIGAAGIPLVAGRSIAVDPARHAMGELLWVDASAPALAGAFPVYRRLTVALDTGGAIRGETRADLYLGEGSAAALEAGRVRHVLRLYRLAPAGPPAR